MTTPGEFQIQSPGNVRERHTVGLHLMVKNGASVVGRLMDQVGPYVSEVVAVLNDCDDDTEAVLRERAARHGVGRVVCVPLTADTHPELYVLDVAATYEVGEPLGGEEFDGPYTGRPLLANWAAARNAGWCRHEADWLLVLDADDVMDDPREIPGACEVLAQQGVEVAQSAYGPADRPRSGWRERLVRRSDDIVWAGCVHERLVTPRLARVARVEGSLVVTDRRDSRGSGLRPEYRNFKVLYHRARSLGWRMGVGETPKQLGERELLCLAAEARRVSAGLAQALAYRLWNTSANPYCAAAACCVSGDVAVDEKRCGKAAGWYERSLAHRRTREVLRRLSWVSYQLGEWETCAGAYSESRSAERLSSPVDLGDYLPDEHLKSLAVESLVRLGRHAEAAEVSEK